ncbi:MAG: hypothetical protein MUC60_07675 [Oscillatoria sp. Prado101]|nr:hypothetical protein [Oscillatoria sp. Prado101]
MFFSRSQCLLGGLAAKICELLEKAPQGQPPAPPRWEMRQPVENKYFPGSDIMALNCGG